MKKNCIDCGVEIAGKNNAKRCKSCSSKHNHKNKEYSKELKEKICLSRKNENEYKGDYYSLKELKKELNKLDINKYTGSGKQRTFIKEEPKIYFSIKKVAEEISKYYEYKGRCILSDIYLINNGIKNCKCHCGKTLKWVYKSKNFQKAPKCCNLGPNSLKRKIVELGEEKGKEKYEKFCKDSSKRLKGFLSLQYFEDKYDNGKEEYQKYWEYNFSKRKIIPYSKISQELFNEIVKEIDEKQCKYATNNGEKRINFNKEDKKIIGEKRVTMFLDFVYRNKVIEFDGDYWHKNSKEEDVKRDIILNNKGFFVLRIREKDYIKNKEKEIKKCLNFLKNL